MKKSLLFFFLLFLSIRFYAQNPECQVFITGDYVNGQTILSVLDSSGTGTPTGYLWDNGQTTPSIVAPTAGTYCVTVTFNGNCTATDCFTVQSDCEIVFYSWPAWNGGYYLSAYFYPNYLDQTYLWSNGATTPYLNNVNPGTYCVTVTAENGCTVTDCYTIDSLNICTTYISTSISSGVPYMTLGAYANPSDSSTIYQWSTGETTQSIDVYAVGNYCVTTTNSFGCVSSSCSSVSCGATISINTAAGTATANSIFGVAPLTYIWSTGETTQTINPSAPGMLGVTITDATGCPGYGMAYYWAFVDTTCNVWIYPFEDSTGTIQLYASGFSSSQVVSYAWSTGETTSFIEADSAGSYCVTITFSSGCSASNCIQSISNDKIYVNLFSEDSISGYQFIADVFLIKKDSVPNDIMLTAVDTLVYNLADTSSNHWFENIAPGKYLIKAALRPNSPGYASFLPTYAFNELFWNEAIEFTMGNVAFNYTYADIMMVEGQNPGGPGFIGGLVSQGANIKGGDDDAESEGDPIANADIVLRTEDGQAVAATRTNAQGRFSFPNLAYGTYLVSLDMMGIKPVHRTITISPAQPAHQGANFKVDEDSAAAVDTDEANAVPFFSIAPNPVNDALHVNLPFGKARASILDLNGKVLYEGEAQQGQTIIPVNGLPQGVYVISLRNVNAVYTSKFVKR